MSDTTMTLIAGILGAVFSHQAAVLAERRNDYVKHVLQAYSVFAAVLTAIAWMKLGQGLRS